MSDKTPIAAEEEVNGAPKSGVEKARNRAIAEGYRYQTLSDRSESEDSTDSLNKKPRRKWSQRDKHYVCILVVTVLIIALMASLLVWQHIRTRDQPCTSEDCVTASSYISLKMDTSVNPCTDFYQFTCGSWLANTEMPASKAKYSAFTVIMEKIQGILKNLIELHGEGNSTAVEKAKLYYNICMDEDDVDKKGNEPLLKLIGELGSWTVTYDEKSGHWDAANWNMLNVLTTNHMLGGDALFSMGIDADDKNHSINIINFQQSGLTLNSYENYRSNHSNYHTLHEAFLNFSTKLGELLGGDNFVKNKMEEVWKLEKSIAEIYVPKEKMLDPEKIYHKMNLSDFQALLGNSIILTEYLSLIFGNRLNVTGDEPVLVYTPEYFVKLKGILEKTEKEILANYIVWNRISTLVGYLPYAFIEAALILNKAEIGVSSVDPRWQRCVSKTDSIFPYVTSALYVRENFPAQGKGEVQNIVQEVKNALISNFPKLSWMDKETKQKAIEKAEAVGRMVAYPDWILAPVELDKYYDKLQITEGQFFQSHLDAIQFYSNRVLDRYGKAPDPTEWHMSPVEVNAYYTQSFNEIVLPAGILQPPFYNPAFPWAFNFGAVGMIIGHELTHGFDDLGRKYDKFGDLKNWWTNESAMGFNKNTQCMEDQYSKYTVEELHIKGDLTLGENIADNGGLKTAYEAYQSFKQSSTSDAPINLPGMDYTDDQMFFIGFGQLWCAHYTPQYAKESILTDEHTMSKYRVWGVVSNSARFSEAFNCDKGTPMNPESKCKLW